MDGFNRARIDVCRLGAPLRSDHCDHNVTEICPLQSIRVTYTRDRCAYVVDLTLYTAESTAFTRQGSLVQIQPCPPFISLVFNDLERLVLVVFPGKFLLDTLVTQRGTKWPLSESAKDATTSKFERKGIHRSRRPLPASLRPENGPLAFKVTWNVTSMWMFQTTPR